MTSLIHILTVIGRAAAEVERVCEELLGRRAKLRPKDGYGTDDWSEKDHKDIDDFCQALIRAARRLPVYYYGAFLDSWTIAHSRFDLLKSPDGRIRVVCGSVFDFTFYPSEFSQDLLAQVKKKGLQKPYSSSTEDRWYVDQIGEALEERLWLEAKFVVVAIRECIDGSRHDDEIKASLESSIDLSKMAP